MNLNKYNGCDLINRGLLQTAKIGGKRVVTGSQDRAFMESAVARGDVGMGHDFGRERG